MSCYWPESSRENKTKTVLVLRPKTYSMEVHKKHLHKLDFTCQNANDNAQQMHSAILSAATRGAIVGISIIDCKKI